MHARCSERLSYSYPGIVAQDVSSKNPEFWRQPLAAKYDMTYEAWWRVEQAIATGAITQIPPTFQIGRKRVYERHALDLTLAEQKFRDNLAAARKHRGDPTTTLPPHLAPPVPQPGVLPFDRAFELAHAEHRALARLNTPPKRKRPEAAPPLQWALSFEIDEDGEFRLTGGMARAERKNGQDAGDER